MAKKISGLVASVAIAFLVVTWSPTVGLAVDKSNYSGKYSLQQKRGSTSAGIAATFSVVQTDEQCRSRDSRTRSKNQNSYPLNGSDGERESGWCGRQVWGTT